MKNNPVYKREMLVRSRSFRIPLIIMIFNGILAVVALLNMYQSIAQVKVSGSVRYEIFSSSTPLWQRWNLCFCVYHACSDLRQHQRGAGAAHIGTHVYHEDPSCGDRCREAHVRVLPAYDLSGIESADPDADLYLWKYQLRGIS